MLAGTSGWLRMRRTSSTTDCSQSAMQSQSMSCPSLEPGPAPTSWKPSAPELRGLEALLEQLGHGLVREELHAAVRVVDHEPFGGAEKLVRDHEGADRVVTGAAAGVANDVGVAFAETGVFRGIEPRIHAGEDREASGGRERELALGPERARVFGVGGEDFLENGHPDSLREALTASDSLSPDLWAFGLTGARVGVPTPPDRETVGAGPSGRACHGGMGTARLRLVTNPPSETVEHPSV